jgi:hypothetical protein
VVNTPSSCFDGMEMGSRGSLGFTLAFGCGFEF